MRQEHRGIRAPRRPIEGPRWIRRSPDAPSHVDPLPGYLCEQCQDAPAVQWQPAPWSGEMGVCLARSTKAGAADEKRGESTPPTQEKPYAR
jgi:hypothetical protein